MTTDKPNTNDAVLNAMQAAWKAKAAAQGLVCLVCGKIPAFERRHHFYDTGLCRACSEELGGGSGID